MLLLLTLLTCQTFASPPVYLGLGEQRRVSFPFEIGKYSVGGPGIRVHVPDPRSRFLMVKAIQNGTTDLWVWPAGAAPQSDPEVRTVKVMQGLESTTEKQLLSALQGLETSEVIVNQDTVLIRGEVSSPREMKQIGAIQTLAPQKLMIETHLSPTLIQSCETELEKALAALRLKNKFKIEAQFNPPRVVGAIAEELLSTTRRSLHTACPLAELDLQTLGEKASTLHFKVFLLELKKTAFNRFGLSPDSIVNGFQVQLTQIQSLMDLQNQFQILSSDGSLRILSKPELAVRSPGEAELFAGGEFPVKMQTRQTQNVIWKNYGLMLKLKVTSSTSEKVRLEISTEVSHLDTTIYDGVPGVKANRMKTQVDAPIGQPLFLSGLLHEGMHSEVKGFPGLKDIPILGALFSSQEYQSEQSELVAILLPHGQPIGAPMHKVGEDKFPKGPVPAPRNWLGVSEAHALKTSADFPWNALE